MKFNKNRLFKASKIVTAVIIVLVTMFVVSTFRVVPTSLTNNNAAADYVKADDTYVLVMDFTLNDYGFMSEETLASGLYGIGTVLGSVDYQTTIASANKVALKIISLSFNSMEI